MSLVLIIHIIIFCLIFFTIIGWYFCRKRKKYQQKEQPRSPFAIKLQKIENRLDEIRKKLFLIN